MYGMYKQEAQGNVPPPAYTDDALGILKHLDVAELQSLLDDEEKLSDLINDLKTVKNVQVDREMLLASNKSLADYNLSKKPRLDQAKGTLAAKYEELVRLRKIYDADKQKIDFLSAQLSLDTTLAVLQTEAAKSEEDSEKMVEDLLMGEFGIQEFMDAYIEKRTVAHTQKIKVEKMSELLRNQNTQPQTNSPYGYGSGSPAMPYPSGQFTMPEPGRYLQR